MKSDGVKLINSITGESYNKGYAGANVEVGAEYNQLRTWFDVDFMPVTPTKGNTEWFAYGITWMWGYKLLRQNLIFNIIPSIGPGVELLNIRNPDKYFTFVDSPDTLQKGSLYSFFGPTLTMELELRLQGPQFSVGIYGGYKVVRHDNFNGRELVDEEVKYKINYLQREINADKVFVGLKLSWTMLNRFQNRERDLE